MAHHVKFVENVFSFASTPTSMHHTVVDIDSALPASSLTLGDYPTLPTSSLSLHQSSNQTTSHPPIPPPSPDLSRSSPSLHLSSRPSNPLIPATSLELPSSAPLHPSSRRAASPLPIPPSSPELLLHHHNPTRPPTDLHPRPLQHHFRSRLFLLACWVPNLASSSSRLLTHSLSPTKPSSHANPL